MTYLAVGRARHPRQVWNMDSAAVHEWPHDGHFPDATSVEYPTPAPSKSESTTSTRAAQLWDGSRYRAAALFRVAPGLRIRPDKPPGLGTRGLVPASGHRPRPPTGCRAATPLRIHLRTQLRARGDGGWLSQTGKALG